MPPFYLNATEGGIDKSTVLKMYSRYTKKLASVQQSIIETTVDIVHSDLKAVGLNIDPRNISVKLKNLVNGDILDELDMMVAAVTGLGEMFENALKLAESPTLDLASCSLNLIILSSSTSLFMITDTPRLSWMFFDTSCAATDRRPIMPNSSNTNVVLMYTLIVWIFKIGLLIFSF